MKRIIKRILIFLVAMVAVVCLALASSRNAVAPEQDVEDTSQYIHSPVIDGTDSKVEVIEQAREHNAAWIDVPETLKPTIIDMPEPTPITMYYTQEDAIMIAKLMYSECRGVKSDTEKACVAWTVLNRVDSKNTFDFPGSTICEVITQKYQFHYSEASPVWTGLLELAEDVLWQWNLEHNGYTNIARVLPSNYLWFDGDGEHNYFRDAYDTRRAKIWDYSLSSPYKS